MDNPVSNFIDGRSPSPNSLIGEVGGQSPSGNEISKSPELKLELNVPEAEIAKRREGWKAPAPRYTRGVQARFAFNASSASSGAVLDKY